MFRSLFLNNRFFILSIGIILLFSLGFSFPFLFPISKLLLAILALFIVLDIILLYRIKGIKAERITPDKLSNGDLNPIRIQVKNQYSFRSNLKIIDEAPIQFQMRDLQKEILLQSGENETVGYDLRPTERGQYSFGAINVFAQSPFGLVSRRYRFDLPKDTAVYPSFLQMRKYELLAISNRLTMMGIKKIRKVGHNMEFEQIRDYVQGDDYRAINWKATARRDHFMVNQYQDERSQNVYAVIDKGRSMKMPFDGLTLLDYAINASLVITNIAHKKHDKPGLITFHKKVDSIVKASSSRNQIGKIQEALYKEKTSFEEPSYEELLIKTNHHFSQRSLLLLFTNFETLNSVHRQLPYLRRLAKKHLLVVIFFENTELDALIHQRPKGTDEIYTQTIAEKFAYEKKQIVKELQKHGIQTVLTPPEHLTVKTINKYLELKARGMI